MARVSNTFRRTALIAVSAICILSLAACQKGNSSAQESNTPLPAVATTTVATTTVATNLDAITVNAEKLAQPQITVPAPWGIDSTKTKVLAEGDGATVGEGAVVEVFYYGLNGATGKKFDENYSSGKTASFSVDQVVPGFKKGLVGQKSGSRVLIAMPSADGYAEGNPNAGIAKGDTILFVVDIVSTSLSQVQGEPQPQDPAMPQVAGDATKPTVTIPEGFAAPAETVAKTIIKGQGQAVNATDSVLVHYQTISAKTGQVLEESYGNKAQQAALPRLIQGWQKGLAGQTVGSRVLLVVPPKDAYGAQGNTDPAVGADETLIFVVDLLSVAKA